MEEGIINVKYVFYLVMITSLRYASLRPYIDT